LGLVSRPRIFKSDLEGMLLIFVLSKQWYLFFVTPLMRIIRAITGTLGMTPTLEELDLWEEHKYFGLTVLASSNDVVDADSTTSLDDDTVEEEEVIESDEATDSDSEDEDSDQDNREDLWVDEVDGDVLGDDDNELPKGRMKQTKQTKRTK
jgi:hypothetical protein